ncbi:glycosyltransferase family 4 protein [Acidobacteria bacterium AB60]|nr:glycosyltransferase family 4 protein [Acidobacteria bacterium AB60]
MRIAQVAPLYESVPPRLYGGTERVVHYLTEELVRQGHDVTLYASGDSQTSARLRAVCKRALRLEGGNNVCPQAPHVLQCELVAQEGEQYDVVHNHADFLLFPQIRHGGFPAITTLHGRLDTPELFPLFREFDDMRLISISNAQRAPMRWASWMATVHHGLPEELYIPQERPGAYLAFLGRVSPEKGLGAAIEIARKAGRKLRVAAKVDAADREYFEHEIKHLLDQPHVEFLGEIGEHQKSEFLGNALALLFPIEWPEPFGLVMIKAMACGTPVIAYRRGSVTEILDDGVTGFIVDDADAAATAVQHVEELNRRRCREVFQRRFSARRMCEDYLRVYEQIMDRELQRACA